jgi:hypothetical protein
MVAGWLVRDALELLFVGMLVFILWIAVGLYPTIQAIRAFFWSRSPWARLGAAPIIPIALAIQIFILWP